MSATENEKENNNQPGEKYIRLAVHEVLKENIARILSLEDNFAVLFDVDFETGEYDEYSRGQEYSEDIKTRLVEYREFFSDSLKNADSLVYAEDREKFKRAMNRDFIRQELEKSPHFDLYYRQVFYDKPVWFKMRFVYKNAEKKRLIIGIFNAEAEMSEVEKNKRLQADLMNRMIKDEGLFLINLADDTRRTIHNHCYTAEYYGDDERYSDSVGRYVNNFVAKSDQALMRKATSIDYITERLKDEPEFTVQYRDLSSRIPCFYAMKIARFSDNEILQSFSNIDKEIIDKLLAGTLKEDFFSLFWVDLDTGKARILKPYPWYNIGKAGEAAPYTSIVLALASSFKGEVREYFEKISNINYLKKRFAGENKITYAYKTDCGGETKWINSTGLVLERRKDGSPAIVAMGFSQMDSDASEKAELQQQLQAALMSAEKANRSKTNFLFSISHDIRTPMNAVTGFTAMAKKYLDDKEKLADYLNKIELSGKQMLSLINQVLEMSRIESGIIELDERPVNIKEKNEAMVTLLEEQAAVNGLEFRHSLCDIVHSHILMDEAKIGQILLNITGNAMKYTPEGGYVDFCLREIPGAGEGRARYCFTVIDNGIGMSREYLKVLFEPFTRERSSTVSHIRGIGLGMSIVKELVKQLGGTVEVQSEPGKGSRFDVTIDFKLADEAPCPREEQPLKKASFAGKRVLLVEDNELNREIAKDILEEFGLTVEEAEDGDVAVNMVKAVAADGDCSYYDAILMDIQMPKLNGYDAAGAIRAEGWRLPIIAMTANAFEEDRRNALAAGMDDHLAKPIEIDKLLNILMKYLQ